MSVENSAKSHHRWIVALITTGTILINGVAAYGTNQSQSSSTQITADFGCVELQQRTITITAPEALSNDRIAQVLVRRGDHVKEGQVITVMKSRDRLEREFVKARARIRKAHIKLFHAQARTKLDELRTQEQQILQLEHKLRNTVTTEQADSLQAQIHRAKIIQNQIARAIPIRTLAEENEMNGAIAERQFAKSQLEQVFVRSPMAGQIAKILARPGELGNNGIVVLNATF